MDGLGAVPLGSSHLALAIGLDLGLGMTLSQIRKTRRMRNADLPPHEVISAGQTFLCFSLEGAIATHELAAISRLAFLHA